VVATVKWHTTGPKSFLDSPYFTQLTLQSEDSTLEIVFVRRRAEH